MKSNNKAPTAGYSALRLSYTGLLGALMLASHSSLAAITANPVSGEVERITLDIPNDIWSGGTMVVGGQNVIIPRNMVIDLPANRLTLQQFFEQAPASCITNGETGLAKVDRCNRSFTGATASILANRNDAGNVIAGDIMLEKATEVVSGVVTYINYDEGYFRIDGEVGSATTGAMVRVNDPDGRHTLQTGTGCETGASNCSADPRYGVDPDNYTFTASTGYPMCIPSTVSRPFDFDTNRNGIIDAGEAGLSAVAAADGTGDALCPQSNRTAIGTPVADSRLFAPLQIGDHVSAEGNFETIGGATFLSAHTVGVAVELITSTDTVQVPEDSGIFYSFQPDYIVFDEAEWDIAGYQNQRARVLLIGFSTLSNPGVDIFALHSDPTNDTYQELITATTVGCDAAAGLGTCTSQGIGVNNSGIFKVVYDVDFVAGVQVEGAPCAHLNAAFTGGGIPRADGTLITSDSRCSNTPGIQHEFAVVTPPSRDLIGRSRHKHTLHPTVRTLDFKGEANTHNGEYLNPVGLGHPEFVEVDLAALQTPFIFAGLPWNNDRRFGPGGCDGICSTENGTGIGTSTMALNPFPYSGLDPDTQAGTPGVPPASAYRILSYWPLTNTQQFVWPPVNLGTSPISPTDHAGLMCSILSGIDSDGDGVDDAIDNCTLVINPLQRDTDSDGYGNFCDADFDGSLVVNLSDYQMFKNVYRQSPLSDLGQHADLNGDGVVNLQDYGLFKSMYRAAPGPSCCAPTP